GQNPLEQSITIINPEGYNVTVFLSEIDTENLKAIKFSAIMAAQIGACAIILFLLAALTKPEKRLSKIFLVNITSLILVIIRSILQIMYYSGPWFKMIAYYGGYYGGLTTSAYATSIAATIMALLLHICILTSLILQVRVVYASHPKLNNIMTAISIFVALVSVGFFTAVCTQVIKAILSVEFYESRWVYTTSRAMLAVSICFFSGIFVAKLGMAIRQRRVLGLEMWGPLQIIFIMGIQTLIIPALFSIIENINTVRFDGMSSLTTCLVAISLPVSSIWAATTSDSP
ncbi:GPCR fungal pheromone mating factor, partial [Peziza echinospora]